MTVVRFKINRAGWLETCPDGSLVMYDDAKRTIQRLSDELFAARMELYATNARHKVDIAALNERIKTATKALNPDWNDDDDKEN